MEKKDSIFTPNNSSYDYILPEKICKIGFNESITITSQSLTEVFHFTRSFNTTISYKACIIKLNIPFCSINPQGVRARILLTLDDEVIADDSKYSNTDWTMFPVFLYGEKCDLKTGLHQIKLKCCVNGGALYLPNYNVHEIEVKIDPPIKATLIAVGIN